MSREETVKDFLMKRIEPHLNDIEELSMQMRDIIEELAEKCEMTEECETISNFELIQFHIEKILETIGKYD